MIGIWSRLPFAVATAVGIGLLAITLAASQLSASSAADELVTVTSPRVTTSALQRMRTDLDKARAVATAIDDEGLARLAALSGQTRSAFLADLKDRAPEVSTGLSEYPAIQTLADTVVTNLERRRGQFESAAALPGLGLTLHDAVWAQLALAVLLVIVGVAGMARPGRLLTGAVLAVGVLLVVTPLALGHPAKTADTDAVLDSLRPFSMEKVRARREALATTRRLFNGFREDVIPQVARKAHAAPRAVAADLAAASAQLAPASLDETAEILDRFEPLVAFSGRIQPLLVKADRLSARASMWLLLGPGVALALAAAIGLVRPRVGIAS